MYYYDQTCDTCVQASPEIDLERNIGGSRTHDLHYSSVTALPLWATEPLGARWCRSYRYLYASALGAYNMVNSSIKALLWPRACPCINVYYYCCAWPFLKHSGHCVLAKKKCVVVTAGPTFIWLPRWISGLRGYVVQISATTLFFF